MNNVHFIVNKGNMTLREQKRQNLVDTARELLVEFRYHEITLDIIAERVGSTKSNFYHYFKSKEELYLEVFLQQVGEKVEAIEEHIAPFAGTNDYESVVGVIAETMGCNKEDNEIGSLLGTTLTNNISDQMAKACEDQMRNATLRVSKSILSALPILTFFEVEQFIDYSLAFKNGLWSEAIASERYKQMFVTIKGNSSESNFVEQLKGGLLLAMKGLMADKNL